MNYFVLFSIIACFGVTFAQQYSASYIEQSAFPNAAFPYEANLFRAKKSLASAPNYPTMLPAASNYVASTVYANPMARQVEEPSYIQSYNDAVELIRMRKHAPYPTYDTNTPFDYEASASTYSAPAYSSPSYSAPAPALYPGPAVSYSYQSHAPTVPCAKNVLVSCSPSVAPVPCAAPSYAPQAYSAPAPVCPYAAASLLGSTHHANGDKEKREISY